MRLIAVVLLSLACALPSLASQDLVWRFSTGDNRDFAKPGFDDSAWKPATLKHKWKCAGYAWFRARVSIPPTINGTNTAGEAVGLKWNAGDGGECYVDGNLFCRYDNDHPALIVLSRSAKAGDSAFVAVRVYMGPDDGEHDGTLDECEMVVIDGKFIADPFPIRVDAGKRLGKMPMSFGGLSQGGGLPDYDDATAETFKRYGIRWFRMDNILTNAVRPGPDGKNVYDWADLDKRLDFMKKVGCEFIACISYMPQPLDAVPNGERHSYPRNWDEFGDLVYAAVRHCADRGTPVKSWEVWNEFNTGWMVDPPGWDHLKTYLTLYDTCWRAVKRADPHAWIGGPALASGPWDQNDPRGPGVNGEKFMRGLLKHCEETGAPLDFISWHEYFQSYGTMRNEAEQIRKYVAEYPKVKKQVKEYAVTEWNYAWWHDRAHDNEVGAAWTAASMLRGWIAAGVQKPCFFYAKDGDTRLTGDWGMFRRDNKPKAVANVCRMFNMLASERVKCEGEDDQIASLSSVDPATGRVTILILNFADRYGPPRKIHIEVSRLPRKLEGGLCRQYLMDTATSNISNGEDRCELQTVAEMPMPPGSRFTVDVELRNNAVTVLELTAPPQS